MEFLSVSLRRSDRDDSGDRRAALPPRVFVHLVISNLGSSGGSRFRLKVSMLLIISLSLQPTDSCNDGTPPRLRLRSVNKLAPVILDQRFCNRSLGGLGSAGRVVSPTSAGLRSPAGSPDDRSRLPVNIADRCATAVHLIQPFCRFGHDRPICTRPSDDENRAQRQTSCSCRTTPGQPPV